MKFQPPLPYLYEPNNNRKYLYKQGTTFDILCLTVQITLRKLGAFMRRILLCFAVLIMFVSISGCLADRSVTLDGKEVIQVNISDFEGFGYVNPDTTTVFADNNSMSIFLKAIGSANRIEGILDVAYAHYNFNVIFKDGSNKGYHLWLYEESGMIMEVNDTHIGYELSEDSVDALNRLIKASQPPKSEVT